MNHPVDNDATPPTLVYLIGRVNQGVRRELQQRLAPHDLSLPELTVLSVLQRRSGLSNAQLARRSLMTPQSMNVVVAELEQRAMVERHEDPANHRILQARLTHKGRGVLRRVTPIAHGLQEELLQDVPEPEREVVVRGLAAAMRRLASG